jgi:hypothetical protein
MFTFRMDWVQGTRKHCRHVQQCAQGTDFWLQSRKQAQGNALGARNVCGCKEYTGTSKHGGMHVLPTSLHAHAVYVHM